MAKEKRKPRKAAVVRLGKYGTEMGDPMDNLFEEASEIIQAVGKYYRFSPPHDVNPRNGKNTIQNIEQEIGDLNVMVRILIKRKILSKKRIAKAERDKIAKLKHNYGYDFKKDRHV